MSLFLYPLFLAGLAAVALPIIAHLFLRPRAKVVRFPMVRFLMATRVDQRNWRRLKDILLLLLRIAIVALIVLMFAQPCLTGGGAGPRHLILALDDTLSMDYRSGQGACFADAVSLACSILNRMGASDRASIISLTGKSGSAIGLDRDAALAQARRAETRPCAADPAGVLARVAEAARSAEPGAQQELFFISDLQKNFWSRLEPAAAERDGALDVVRAMKAGPADRPNQAVAEAAARGASLRARLANHSEAEIRATLDARCQTVSLGRTNLALAPQSSQWVEFPLRRPEALDGPIPVDVVMETGDGLEADNHFRLILPAAGASAPRALLVETAPGGGFFIRKAIASLGLAPGGPSCDIETIKPEGLAERLAPRAGGGSNVLPLVIFQGLKGPEQELAAALKGFLEGGGMALVFLDAGTDLRLAGQLFQAGLLPLQPLAYERKDRRLAGADREGAFTKDLAESPSADFMSYGAFTVKPAPAARVSAWLEGGAPFVATLACGAGHSLMINTSADAELSAFVKSSLLLPFLAAALRPGMPASALPRRAGDRVRLPAAGEKSVKIITPSGRLKELPAEAAGNEAVLEADETGFYRDADGRPLLAVNAPLEESDLRSFSASEAETLLMARCRLADKPREVSQTGASLEGKVPLWRWLGLLALALAAGELFAANRMKR